MSDIDYVEMGKRIKDRRKEKGLSQKSLAESIGLEYRTLIKWEKGDLDHKIDFPVFLKLCDELKIDVPFLLGNDYSTKELETVCSYTGLSEKAAKLLNLYSGTYETQNVANFLSDLIGNHIEFLMFLEHLEQYMCNEFIKKTCSKVVKDTNLNSYSKVLYKTASEDSDISLFQCQRVLGSLDVENDEYIKEIALESVMFKTLYQSINADLPPTSPI